MDYIHINKNLWNEKTRIHYQSAFYNVEAFLAGKDSLNPIEMELLGNIENMRILHLQCHFGMDSISMARRGAKVTGIDLSEESIRRAEELNKRTGSDVRFIQTDLYRLPERLQETYDIVFTSYGVVGWLPDMDRWAGIISQFLKPGGRFVMVEFHPVLWIFNNSFRKIVYNYSDKEPIVEEYEGTYADPDASIKCQAVCWNHGLSPVLNGLIKQGLIITRFDEYDYSPYDCFENTVKIADGIYRIRDLEKKIPMLYSISAVKPSDDDDNRKMV